MTGVTMIDLGNTPTGTPPDSGERAQLRTALGLPAITPEEITAGTGTDSRSYSPADVSAQVRAQQVHWQTELSTLRWGSSTIDGIWPQLLEMNNLNGDNDSTGVRFLGSAPNLYTINLSAQMLDSTALAALLADVARNADEFTIENGSLDMSDNPGTLDTSNSEIAANLAILDDLGWNPVTYPILTVPSGTGGSYSGGNATVYWDDLPAGQSVDIEINGLFHTNVGGDTSPYTVSPGAGTTTVFRLRAKSDGGVVTDWTSEITVTIPE